MKRIRPIPEDCSFEAAAVPATGDHDIAYVVDELKEALKQPSQADRELLKAISALRSTFVEKLGALSTGNSSVLGPPLRLGVFADTANLTDRISKDPTVIEYGRLLQWVKGSRRLMHARAYCPVYADYGGRLEDQRSVGPVWNKGYDIVTKPVKVFADGTRKADLDIVLAVDVIRRLDTMDVLALMSGDGDFVPVVELVRERGVRVELYCFRESLAEELRLAADDFYDLHQIPEVHAGKNGSSSK